MLYALDNFTWKQLIIMKSIDNKTDFISGQASKPYTITAIHLLIYKVKFGCGKTVTGRLLQSLVIAVKETTHAIEHKNEHIVCI